MMKTLKIAKMMVRMMMMMAQGAEVTYVSCYSCKGAETGLLLRYVRCTNDLRTHTLTW